MVQQGGRQSFQTVQGIPVPYRDWTNPLCSKECCSDWDLCCLAYWCPCMAYAQNFSRFRSGTVDECGRCMSFAALWPGIPIVTTLLCAYWITPVALLAWVPCHSYVACYSSPFRRQIREKYLIKEADCWFKQLEGSQECCIHACCLTCALIQEHKELNVTMSQNVQVAPVGQVMPPPIE
ncbi:hypothetical protein CYMTET_38390 [Cymbomonas tetramitiformis]|uniref:Uncharacterized protein n=1 Tax=Cymbomonas tetramitiformis TaxID=36881 RepID=A0AAE0CC33_9CHLO|nr:hypothetical protein CYMTET_38390 [Cymbomonas tetramitiformis]